MRKMMNMMRLLIPQHLPFPRNQSPHLVLQLHLIFQQAALFHIHLPTASTIEQIPTNSASQHLFTPVPGPRVILEDDSQPYDYFCQIWGCDTFKFIAEQTNLYAAQKGTSPWENVSEDEMKAFFGIQVRMGLVPLPIATWLLEHQPLDRSTPGIVKGMSRNRFRSILSHLHLNDNFRMP